MASFTAVDFKAHSQNSQQKLNLWKKNHSIDSAVPLCYRFCTLCSEHFKGWRLAVKGDLFRLFETKLNETIAIPEYKLRHKNIQYASRNIFVTHKKIYCWCNSREEDAYKQTWLCMQGKFDDIWTFVMGERV